MPVGFAGDGAKVNGAEELHQIDLRDVVDIVFPERLDVPLLAPVVDGGLDVYKRQGFNISTTVIAHKFIGSASVRLAL